MEKNLVSGMAYELLQRYGYVGNRPTYFEVWTWLWNNKQIHIEFRAIGDSTVAYINSNNEKFQSGWVNDAAGTSHKCFTNIEDALETIIESIYVYFQNTGSWIYDISIGD